MRFAGRALAFVAAFTAFFFGFGAALAFGFLVTARLVLVPVDIDCSHEMIVIYLP